MMLLSKFGDDWTMFEGEEVKRTVLEKKNLNGRKFCMAEINIMVSTELNLTQKIRGKWNSVSAPFCCGVIVNIFPNLTYWWS